MSSKQVGKQVTEQVVNIVAKQVVEQIANQVVDQVIVENDNIIQYSAELLHDKEGIFDYIFGDKLNDVASAMLFYCLEPLAYIYDIDNSDWYCMNEYGIWIKDNDCTILGHRINISLLQTIEKEYITRLQKITNDEEKTKITNFFVHARRYLNKNSSKHSIINELAKLYKQTKVFEQIDNMNDYIMAFKNGVYDFQTNEFRKAKPEELISCTTGYNYDKPNIKVVNEVQTILESIFPNKDELTYILKTISLGLVGSNVLEEFYIWMGDGQNGKGLLSDLIRHTLGGYYDVIDIDYFCKTKHSISANGADPVMARNKNSRIVITSDPECDTQLSISKLKKIFGHDEVLVRELYKAPFNFVPKFKLIIQTNSPVIIDGSDNDVIGRLRVITFPNKFVNNPTKSNHRRLDIYLKDKIKDIKYRLAFFNILVYHYNKFVTDDNSKLEMPIRIKNDTQNYLNDNDPLNEFIDDHIDITNNKKDFVLSTELYNKYTSIYKNNSQVSMMTFKTKLIAKGIVWKKKMHGNGYEGIKIRKQEV